MGLLISGLNVVLRVQIREQKKGIITQGLTIINQLAQGGGVKKSRASKFFLLQTYGKFKKKLLRFRFIAGYDVDNPDKKFTGDVKGPKVQRLHDLAAQAVAFSTPVVVFEESESSKPSLILAITLPNGNVAVMVRPVDIKPPPIPWLGIFANLLFAIITVIFIPKQ